MMAQIQFPSFMQKSKAANNRQKAKKDNDFFLHALPENIEKKKVYYIVLTGFDFRQLSFGIGKEDCVS